MKNTTCLVLTLVLNCASDPAAAVAVRQTGNGIVLANEKVSLKLDLERRRFAVTDVVTKDVVLDDATMAADSWGRDGALEFTSRDPVGRLLDAG
jgi:hypothetical protein